MNVRFLRAPRKQETPDTHELLLPSIAAGSRPQVVAEETQKSKWRGLRLVGLIAGVAVIAGGLLVGGFFLGQSTRDSASVVKQKLADQAAHDHARASAALEAQSDRLNKKVSRVADQARADGYSSGQSDGYSSGQSAGYESGVSDGTTQGYGKGYGDGSVDGYSTGSYDGYTQGFDEGTCYDPYTYEYVC
jgi:hypothetical protein